MCTCKNVFINNNISFFIFSLLLHKFKHTFKIFIQVQLTKNFMSCKIIYINFILTDKSQRLPVHTLYLSKYTSAHWTETFFQMTDYTIKIYYIVLINEQLPTIKSQSTNQVRPFLITGWYTCLKCMSCMVFLHNLIYAHKKPHYLPFLSLKPNQK